MRTEQLTQSECIFQRDTRLWNTEPQADRLRDAWIREHAAESREVNIARAWQVATGLELHAVAGALVVDDRGRVRQGHGVLNVKIFAYAPIYAASMVGIAASASVRNLVMKSSRST
jgi:hypothetical protein